MKVSELISMLENNYSQDEEIFVMWWDGWFLEEIISKDETTSTDQVKVIWEQVVKTLEADDYLDSIATNMVNEAVATVSWDLVKNTQEEK